ncbi:hypothetical protein Tco_0459436 [Tanacetum coccineum]
MLLAQQQEAGIEIDAEQQYFLANGLEGFDSDCEELQLNATSILMTKKVDTYDLEVDDAPTANAIFMAKLSHVGSINGDEVDKLRWLAKILKKGSLFRSNSKTNKPPSRTYQLWKKTFYEDTHTLDDMTEFPKSQPKKTYEEDLESEMVMVKMPSCMSFLGCTNAYDEPIGNLDKMVYEVENPSPQSTPQVLPTFKEYTPPVTCTEEIEETLGTPIEVEPLDQTKLEDIDLTNHNISLSSREIPSVDEPEPQLLCKFSPLDVNLGDKGGTDPPINPYSLGSFRLKVVDQLTIHIPPSPHVAYYHPESKEVSFLGEGLNLPIRTKELEKALGWHLEEIHVILAPLEKKRIRLRLYTVYLEELYIQSVETASRLLIDGVRIFKVTASWIWRRLHDLADLKWL